MKKYGVFLGRFQPFHVGHQHIIDKIIADGLIPVIIVGSSQEYGTEKNPYHPQERVNMIQLVYPDIKIITLIDEYCWDAWYTSLKNAIEIAVSSNLDEVTVYLHEKLEDLQDFTFRGIDYFQESYCKMYEIDGMHTTPLPLSDIQIRAKKIREDFEGNKQFLHPKVYKYLKALNC